MNLILFCHGNNRLYLFIDLAGKIGVTTCYYENLDVDLLL